MRHAADDPRLSIEPIKWFGMTLLHGLCFVLALQRAFTVEGSPTASAFWIITAVLCWVLFATYLALFTLAVVDYVRARRRQ